MPEELSPEVPEIRRPSAKTIRHMVAWLEQHGLRVYGQSIDADTGREFDGLSDYTADDVIKITRLLNAGKTWSPEQ
jgi:hypothetical protein